MKSRKERIQAQKEALLTKKIKSLKKATTYIGTSLLVGTATLSSLKGNAKAADANVLNQENEDQKDKKEQTTENPTPTVVTEQQKAATPKVMAPAPPARISRYASYAAVSAPTRFINTIGAEAKAIADRYGIYASLMIAQAGLESAWGQSYLATSAHNLFGVKWRGTGQYIILPTQEYYGGKYHTVNAKFQRYNSYSEALTAYANLITHNFYNSTRANAGSVQTAAYNLRHGKYGCYATAPNYAPSLLNVIKNYNLTRFDLGGSAVTPAQPTTPDHSSSHTTSGGTYTVKAGDSLWAISQRTGVSVNNLIAWNNIKANFIYPGQVLKLSYATPQTPNKPVTPAKPSHQISANGTYTVKSGDSLWLIANNHKMSINELKQLNNLTSNFIYPGQVLKIVETQAKPIPKPQPKPTPKPARPSRPTTGGYTVKSGDSIWKIANDHHMSMSELKSLNNLTSNFIYPGQVLKVKGSTTKPVRPSRPTTGGYTVKSGDSIWKIAHDHHMSMSELKSLNNLSSDFIYPGQILKVKGSTSSHSVTPARPSRPSRPSQPSRSTGGYTVKSGDSIWKIAHDHHMSMSELKSLNNLSSDFIYPGQVLKVKGSTASRSTSHTNTSSSRSTSRSTSATYQVKAGDSLWLIANKYGITISSLKSYNNLPNNFIYPGQTLKIPGKYVSVNKRSARSTSYAKRTYNVVSGDSLWKIAQANGMTVNQLKTLNHLTSDSIYVGQKLRLN
ncbi:LysM peptidoglycan-binding domain-containing protein [Ligilactobacillus ceti]|uniref:Peptidoglycan hydrolase n=1 Tax=Ligilactobacillus ceti DSM 22408 TaxID=1122146 RepID=A0A0R2KGH6_9LACO|nr:LysM peptidoglycan-binding domain-containing protein [Ligilactobacillus ceti]KRN88488.1 N-acetylmuramoyl-L-alanine amidase [Ligilactobacillus ceti DSM 22408]